MDSLLKRKNELVNEIAKIESLRRGQISEQYYEKINVRGERVRTGPYYVRKASVKGSKRSIRIRSNGVGTARKEVEDGKRHRALCEEPADVPEHTAMAPAGQRAPLPRLSLFAGSDGL
jgi:hypothetical protein